MASTRGQNVSVLHLRHAADVENSPNPRLIDDEKTERCETAENASETDGHIDDDPKKKSAKKIWGSHRHYRGRVPPPSEPLSAAITNGIGYPTMIDPGGRESSPLRWYNRKSDGVYVGSSGWVQVQQEPSDRPREPMDGRSSNPSLGSGNLCGSRECFIENEQHSRPVYLPIKMNKNRGKNAYKSSSLAYKNAVPASPSWITPIISPPPAFKDSHMGKEFFNTTICLPGRGSPSCTFRPEVIERDDGSLVTTIPIFQNGAMQRTKSSQDNHIDTLTSIGKAHVSHRMPGHDYHVSDKSEKANSRSPICVSAAVNSRFQEGCDKFNSKNFGRISDATDSDGENYSCLDSPEYIFISKNEQRGERRTRRLSSSSSSPSSSSSASSSPSSPSRTPSLSPVSPSYLSESNDFSQKRWQTARFRGAAFKDGRPDFDVDDDRKNLNVRRSRSLQFPQRRSSRSKNSTTATLDRQRYPNSNDHTPLQTKNYSRCPKSSDDFFSSHSEKPHRQFRDERQRDLVREAAEEARIVTEFLNGRRSREAARSLLFHRYLSRPENDPGNNGIKISSKSGYEIHTLPIDKGFKKSKFHQSETGRPRRGYSITGREPLNSRVTSNDFARAAGVVEPSPSFFSDRGNNGFKQFICRNTREDHRRDEDDDKPLSRTPAESMYDFGSPKAKLPSRQPHSMAENSRGFRNGIRRSSIANRDRGERSLSGTQPSRVSLNRTEERISARESMDEEKRYKTRSASENSFRDSASLSTSSSSSEVYVYSSPVERRKSRSSATVGDWVTAADPRYFNHSSGLEEGFVRRPLSAPMARRRSGIGYFQQRSMSLPKSFLSMKSAYNKQRSPSPQSLAREFIERGNRDEDVSSFCTKQLSRTAPATPTRDVREITRREGNVACLRRSDYSKPNRSPLTRELATEGFDEAWKAETVRSSLDDELMSLPKLPENVLNKFKKSLTTKIYKEKGMSKTTRFSKELDHQMQNSKGTKSYSHPLRQNEVQFQPENIGTDVKFSKSGSLFWRGKKSNSNSYLASEENNRLFEIQMGVNGFCGGGGGEHSELRGTNRQELNQFGADAKARLSEKDTTGNAYNCSRTESINGPTRERDNTLSSSSKNEKSACRRSSGSRFSKTTKRTRLRRSCSHPTELNKSSVSRDRYCARTLSENERDFFCDTSEDEVISESESSLISLTNTKFNSFDSESCEGTMLADALWDHMAIGTDELPFKAGEVIRVLERCDPHWWWGTAGKRSGYFPSAFVRMRARQRDVADDRVSAAGSGKSKSNGIHKNGNISLLSSDQVRSIVVQELLNTERSFVKVLNDIAEGFLVECRRRSDMFTPGQVHCIFANLEDLLIFQKNFLSDLESNVNSDIPYESCIGKVFINHKSGFRVYSEYCNSHPTAIATLQDLYKNINYLRFFEACRLMRGLMEIPLDGYLLTPIQRICKYPLQLAELLKYTKPEHPDHEMVRQALEAMKKVANLINERKRKMESIEKLAAWQSKVENWEGEDLTALSSQLIHQGDVVRITSGVWTNNVTLFLFDHQIIYCKKDLLKRNAYSYKGRIFLDTSDIIDLPDGKNQQFGVTVKHGVKIYDYLDEKWLIFCCRSGEEKTNWLKALMEERNVVAQDKLEGLELPLEARQLAKMAVRPKNSSEKPKRKSIKETNYSGSLEVKGNRRGKVGGWFMFGAGGKRNSGISLRTSSPSFYLG